MEISQLISALPRFAALLTVLVAFEAVPAVGQRPLAVPPEAVAVQEAVVGAIARCERAVVAIRGVRMPVVTRLLTPPDRFAPLRESGTQGSEGELIGEFGTGVVLDAAGLILTHYEVIRGADTLEVTTADRRSYTAKIVGADQRSGLAVLSIEASGLPTIPFGDASQVRKGEFVVALGNPYGIAEDGQASASMGIIANFGRKSALKSDREKVTLGQLGWLLQTDAKLYLGTSGGALVNLKGEMIGLTTSVAATAGYDQAAGYAIPLDAAFRRIVQALREGKEVEYGLLGVYLDAMGDRGSEMGLVPQGALVRDVIPGAPAHQAKLQTGDVITHVNDLEVTSSDVLMLAVSKREPLETVRLTHLRGGRSREVAVVLSKSAPRGDQVVTTPAPTWRGMQVDFATSAPNYADLAREGSIDFEGCVYVRAVVANSPAWQAGIRSGNFISKVDSARTATPETFHLAANQQAASVSVELVLPNGESRRVRISHAS